MTSLVLDEFIDLAKRGAASPAEEEQDAFSKQDMCDRLMSLPADEVYDALRGA